MKRTTLFLLAAVVIASGCTSPQFNVQTAGYNRTAENATYHKMYIPLPGWYCGSLKLNASLVEGRMDAVAEAAMQAGFSFIGISGSNEHETAALCRQAESYGFLCFQSQEAGNNEGIFVAVGINGTIPREDDLDRMIDYAHKSGAFVYISRPTNSVNKTPWKRWDITEWDGIAVVSPMFHTKQDDYKAVEKWYMLLNNGYRKYAIGETDIKPFTSTYSLKSMIETSYICVNAGELTENSLKDAMVSGRFYVTNGPLINFTVNGVGPGGIVNATYGSEVVVNLAVKSDSVFNTIRIIRDGTVIAEIGKPAIRYNMSLNSTVLSDSWFAAEVWGNDYTAEYHDPVHAISNPVWVNVSLNA